MTGVNIHNNPDSIKSQTLRAMTRASLVIVPGYYLSSRYAGLGRERLHEIAGKRKNKNQPQETRGRMVFRGNSLRLYFRRKHPRGSSRAVAYAPACLIS